MLLHINTAKPYDVFIENGLLDRCGALIRSVCGGSRALTVCGDTVSGLYADRLEHQLRQNGYAVSRFVYPHGESGKNAATFIELLGFTAGSELDRDDIIVSLGGGVTGDLAGFASACYMRGINYVQIPTTLLAMTDSCIGGKTAIDLDCGKNLAGVFHQPKLVICDPLLLGTLPRSAVSEGCAEIIKYAMLGKTELVPLLRKLPESTERVIFECLDMKRRFVEIDEHDRGERRMLNLGHTVAHALELASGYTIPHGKAVAVGLAAITGAAVRYGDCPPEVLERLVSLLGEFGLPLECEYGLSELCKLIYMDKKRNSVNITLVIPRDFGECELRTMPLSEAMSYISGSKL